MLLSQVILETYGWRKVAAKITPPMQALELLLFSQLCIYVGGLQNIFSKSDKYNLFDPCKETAYIPLDEGTMHG